VPCECYLKFHQRLSISSLGFPSISASLHALIIIIPIKCTKLVHLLLVFFRSRYSLVAVLSLSHPSHILASCEAISLSGLRQSARYRNLTKFVKHTQPSIVRSTHHTLATMAVITIVIYQSSCKVHDNHFSRPDRSTIPVLSSCHLNPFKTLLQSSGGVSLHTASSSCILHPSLSHLLPISLDLHEGQRPRPPV